MFSLTVQLFVRWQLHEKPMYCVILFLHPRVSKENGVRDEELVPKRELATSERGEGECKGVAKCRLPRPGRHESGVLESVHGCYLAQHAENVKRDQYRSGCGRDDDSEDGPRFLRVLPPKEIFHLFQHISHGTKLLLHKDCDLQRTHRPSGTLAGVGPDTDGSDSGQRRSRCTQAPIGGCLDANRLTLVKAFTLSRSPSFASSSIGLRDEGRYPTCSR